MATIIDNMNYLDNIMSYIGFDTLNETENKKRLVGLSGLMGYIRFTKRGYR